MALYPYPNTVTSQSGNLPFVILIITLLTIHKYPFFLLQACYQNVSLMHCCPSAGASSFVKRIDRTRVTVISDASTCAMYIVHTCFVRIVQVVVIGAAYFICFAGYTIPPFPKLR